MHRGVDRSSVLGLVGQVRWDGAVKCGEILHGEPAGRPRRAGCLEKRGLTAALADVGVHKEASVAFADEMRICLYGQVRRVLAPRGMDVRQVRQLCYEWIYLALAVDGQVSWTWLVGMDASEIEIAVETWQADGIDAIVWDGASSHRGTLILEQDLPRVVQPPASPELNPAERVFEELRRRIEGRPYPSLAAKMLLVENTLRRWAADPERIRQLCGWDWILDSLKSLPE